MMHRRILRETVPVDDAWHVLELGGDIEHVATRGHAYVEIWFLDDPGRPVCERCFRVFGTGQPIEGRHVGTALTPDGLVWHLMEREL